MLFTYTTHGFYYSCLRAALWALTYDIMSILSLLESMEVSKRAVKTLQTSVLWQDVVFMLGSPSRCCGSAKTGARPLSQEALRLGNW